MADQEAQGNKDLQVKPVLLVHRVTRVGKVREEHLANLDKQAKQAHLDQVDSLDHQDHQDPLESLVQEEHKDPEEKVDQQDQVARLVQVVSVFSCNELFLNTCNVIV
jgi:hypothetical protein